MDRRHKKTFILAAGLILYVAVLHFTVGCPIRFATGIACPGCGMTRALLCAARLDFSCAFYYHPLFFMVPLCAVLYAVRRRIPKKIMNGMLIAGCFLVVAVYIMRLLDPACDVVPFRPQDGLIFRTIRTLADGIMKP